MTLSILGWGTALPEHAIAQSDAAALAMTLSPPEDKRARLVAPLYRRSGVRQRHSVLLHRVSGAPPQTFYRPSRGTDDRGPTTRQRMECYRDEALPLAVRAARGALEQSGLAAARLTHLITVSCSGFSAPGIDVGLIRELELPPTVARTHVGFMGCHGALSGLRLAAAFAAAQPDARVLLCAVELCSLHFQYAPDPEQMVANALFADGAAALVAAATEPSGIESQWRAAAAGSCVFPNSADAITWNIGDHGFEMTLSARVPGLIRARLRPWLADWLVGAGLALEAVGSWAVHPGGPRILQAVEAALDLPREATAVSRAVLAECGNMSSPTVLFILDRLARQSAPRPCVALGFGPGLAVEAALFI